MFSALEGKAGERSAEQQSEGSQSGMRMRHSDFHIWVIMFEFIANTAPNYCQCSV